ncbi:MAG: hypothetical protein IH840_00690 [Candidatus Heimdallarchaeota archaeon]|nr:hypothetical protein [Candidatus Heimdallarchaeota archaeon]
MGNRSLFRGKFALAGIVATVLSYQIKWFQDNVRLISLMIIGAVAVGAFLFLLFVIFSPDTASSIEERFEYVRWAINFAVAALLMDILIGLILSFGMNDHYIIRLIFWGLVLAFFLLYRITLYFLDQPPTLSREPLRSHIIDEYQ